MQKPLEVFSVIFVTHNQSPEVEEPGKEPFDFPTLHIDAHRYEATANDVVGVARGEAYGNAFRWEYTLALKPGNPFSHVHLRQWMYLQPGTQTMFTRAIVRKFGFTVGEVAESFQRIPPTGN